MKIRIFQIDAFARELFRGNPAAVCPLEAFLPDATLLAIAAENNLSETAFIVRRKDGADNASFDIRWFTPTLEVALCGHATLAAAWVAFNELRESGRVLRFSSLSGPLLVEKQGERLALDFPTRVATRCDPPDNLLRALGVAPQEVHIASAAAYLCVYRTEKEVRALSPDMALLSTLDRYGVIVTAPGDTADFVSRFFAPAAGIPEDPVTGSAHCTLIPYWASRLGRAKLYAQQLSKRGGELFCESIGERVVIAGYGVKYLEGTIEVGLVG
ncbi:MAG: PhzF family phenazine biosynthesis protein [Polyangiales bacterium]